MATSKDGFILYKSFYGPISKLSDKQLGRLLRAIFCYQLGEVVSVEEDIEMAFAFFKNQFDLDEAKYQGNVERNAENGRKGGNPNFKKGQSNPYYKKEGNASTEKGGEENSDKITEDNRTLSKITEDNPKDKDKEKDKDYEKESTNVDTKDIAPVGADCANIPVVPKKTIRTWREDFEVYKQDLKSAYESLVNDWAFIAERQKYDPKLDIRLSMEKAYNDYWSTEAGWKKKKAARSKELDWKRTFVNALSLGSNKVYLNASNRVLYEPATESQKKFTAYLKEHAPLLLNMVLQPTDEEIELLRKYPNDTLRSVVEEINNNRYLTNGRNSVYQTILEVMSKK